VDGEEEEEETRGELGRAGAFSRRRWRRREEDAQRGSAQCEISKFLKVHRG